MKNNKIYLHLVAILNTEYTASRGFIGYSWNGTKALPKHTTQLLREVEPTTITIDYHNDVVTFDAAIYPIEDFDLFDLLSDVDFDPAHKDGAIPYVFKKVVDDEELAYKLTNAASLYYIGGNEQSFEECPTMVITTTKGKPLKEKSF